MTGQGFELKPLTIRRRGHFKRQDSRSLSPKESKSHFCVESFEASATSPIFFGPDGFGSGDDPKKNLGEKNRRASVFKPLNFHFVLWLLKRLPRVVGTTVFFALKPNSKRVSFGTIEFFY